MAEIQITTTQNVVLSFKVADLNLRAFAWLIDVVIKIAYLWLMGVFFDDFLNFSLGYDYWSKIALDIIISIPVTFYTFFQETFFEGQTVGKKVLNIKVLKIDGYQTNLLDFFIRWIMRIVDVFASLGVVALISIGTSNKGQRLGGIVSGTAVVDLRNKFDVSHTILEEGINEGYKPTFPSVVKLSDNDVRIIKENYTKAKKTNNHGLLVRLKEKITLVIGKEPLEGQTASAFIDTVIKDYNHFTQNM